MRRISLALIGGVTLLSLLAGCQEALTGASSPNKKPTDTTPSPQPVASPTVSARPVRTLAGGAAGNQDGSGDEARFRWPFGIAVSDDQVLYVADRLNHRIRRVTGTGEVSSLAGSTAGTSGFADGVGDAARFDDPQGLAVDASGSVYVADSSNHRIRKILADGSVETLAGSTQGSADGVGGNAKFSFPAGLALDDRGNLLVADRDNHRIRRVTPLGEVDTLTGEDAGYVDGPRSAARFNHPQGIYMGRDGFTYVADSNNHCIRKVTPSGEVTTLAGNGTPGFADGTGNLALFRHPIGLTGDGAGHLYVADWGNNRIRRISTSGGIVTTLAGTGSAGYLDGTLATAQFNMPAGLARTSSGSLAIADYGNHRIRLLTP